MSLPALLAVFVLALPRQQDLSVDEVLAPILDTQGIATACFSPSRWQGAERSRECQYRLIREEEARASRQSSLRDRCERTPAPGEPVEACMRRLVTAEIAAREARTAELRARLEPDAGDDPFDLALARSYADAPPAAATPDEPAPPRRPRCRRETTQNPDGSGGSVAWVCGDNSALESLRESLRPQPAPPGF